MASCRSTRACAEARVACPQRLTSMAGVNQRKSKCCSSLDCPASLCRTKKAYNRKLYFHLESQGLDFTQLGSGVPTVSLRFISAATLCRYSSAGKLPPSRYTTAAALPLHRPKGCKIRHKANSSTQRDTPTQHTHNHVTLAHVHFFCALACPWAVEHWKVPLG